MKYRLHRGPYVIKIEEDGTETVVSTHLHSSTGREYLAWLAEGNKADPFKEHHHV